jgi:hypothetical protein
MKRRKANAKTMKKPQRRTRLGLMKRKRITRKAKRGGAWRYDPLENVVKAEENERFKETCKEKSDDCKDVIDAVKTHIERSAINQLIEFKHQNQNYGKFRAVTFDPVEEHEQQSVNKKLFEFTKQGNFDEIIKNIIFKQDEKSESDDSNPDTPPKQLLDNSEDPVMAIIDQLPDYYTLKYIDENPEDDDVKKYKEAIEELKNNQEQYKYFTEDTMEDDAKSQASNYYENYVSPLIGEKNKIFKKIFKKIKF